MSVVRVSAVLRPVCLPLRVRPRVCPVPELRFVDDGEHIRHLTRPRITRGYLKNLVLGGFETHAPPQPTHAHARLPLQLGPSGPAAGYNPVNAVPPP